MERKARLHDVSFDAKGHQRVTFELCERADLSDLQDKDIRLKAVRWRERRSLNANGYFYALAGQIAQATSQSLTEVHNQLISDYGRVEMNGDTVMNIIMDTEVDWRKLEGIHLHPTSGRRVMDNGRMYQVYLVMRGSHTYDSKEMSTLLDGTIAEAQSLGIDTITENQKAEMLQKWGISSDKAN